MRTRSQTCNRNRQQQAPPAVGEPFNLEEPFDNPPLVPMTDNRTMAELLQAPTEGYEDAIVIPEINANFELKHGLINLVQNKQFFGHDKEDPHAHIRYFNKITSTMRFPDIPNTSIKLMLFPFSLEVVPVENQNPVSEPVVAPVCAPMPNPKSSIPYPSRRNDEKRRENANEQKEKFYEIFKDMSFEISFVDALTLMPKFSSTLKALIGNKEKLSEMARTPLNEHCSAWQPTPGYDPIVSNSSPTLTPFGDSDFLLLEEADAFLALADIQPPLEVMILYDPSGHSYLEALLNNNNKLPVIIAKDLSVDEKTALIKVLKSQKRAIAWKLSDIKGINPEFCSHKILLEEDYEPAVQHQRRVNPKIHDVIKKEVEKLLDVGLIYPISDSPWVSPVHCVPKKGGMIVVTNDENELVPTRLVTGWRVCIDYRKLNEATRKDHFPLPFMDQMLERLAGNEYYYFLDGFSGYFQIPIDPKDQEKTTFTCPYETFAYRRMPFGLCNAPALPRVYDGYLSMI
ncbi:reverse transcriptase domain-containing protein [Tanacetum coccineum]